MTKKGRRDPRYAAPVVRVPHPARAAARRLAHAGRAPRRGALTMRSARLRGLAVAVMLVLLAVSAGAAFRAFVSPSEQRWVGIGSIDAFPPGSVTPFGDGVRPVAFYAVRLAGGDLLALAARLVHPNPACIAEYRPGFVFQERTGWFIEPCRNAVFDMAGVQSAAPLAARSRAPRRGRARRSRLRRSDQRHAGCAPATGGLRLPIRRRAPAASPLLARHPGRVQPDDSRDQVVERLGGGALVPAQELAVDVRRERRRPAGGCP